MRKVIVLLSLVVLMVLVVATVPALASPPDMANNSPGCPPDCPETGVGFDDESAGFWRALEGAAFMLHDAKKGPRSSANPLDEFDFRKHLVGEGEKSESKPTEQKP